MLFYNNSILSVQSVFRRWAGTGIKSANTVNSETYRLWKYKKSDQVTVTIYKMIYNKLYNYTCNKATDTGDCNVSRHAEPRRPKEVSPHGP